MLNEQPFAEPKLRVLALTPTLLAGGAEQHLASLIRHSLAVKYVGVISLEGWEGYPTTLDGSMSCPVYKHKVNPGEDHSNAIARAVRKRRKLNYDLVMYWGFSAIDLSFLDVPVVHVQHASGMETGNHHHKEWLRQKAESNAHFHVAVSASAVYSFSERIRDKAKIHVIHNGADVERTREVYGREWQREHWGIPEDKKVMLYVGRFFEGKGCETALQSLAYLPEDYVLVLYGWGKMADDLRKMAKSFPGRVYFPQPRIRGLGDIYAAADMVVLPSETEAFPLVMVEAWQAGVPLVCSQFNTLLECEARYNNDNHLAYHIPCPPSPKDVAEKVLEVDPNSKIVLDALDIGLNELTASKMVGRWEKFFYWAVAQWQDSGIHGAVEVI